MKEKFFLFGFLSAIQINLIPHMQSICLLENVDFLAQTMHEKH